MKSMFAPVLTFAFVIVAPLTIGVVLGDSLSTDSQTMEADRILKRYVQAIGGRDRLERVQSLRLTGTLERHGTTIPFVRSQRQPNSFLQETRFPRPGTLKQGFDGNKGWILHPLQGGRYLKGKGLNKLEREAELFPMLTLEKNYAYRKYVGTAVVTGQQVSIVHLAKKSSDKPERWSFDKTDGFLRQIERLVDGGPHGKISVIIQFEDYQTYDEIWIPTTVRTKLPTVETLLRIKKTELNLSLDDSIFSPPF